MSIQSHNEVLVTQSGRVRTIAFNRPDRLNALGAEMRDDLLASLSDADADDNVGAVILTGEGRAFCAGGDVKGMRARLDAPPDPLGQWARSGSTAEMVESITGFSKPLIAAVNGAATGAGCGLALLADIVIAAESARFGVPFRNYAMVPDAGVSWTLPRLVGWQAAKELIFTGRLFDANEALRLGLVLEVVSDDELLGRTLELATRIADGPTIALVMAKELLAASRSNDLGGMLRLEASFQPLAQMNPQHREGVQAFLEKRPARFHADAN